MKNCLATFLLFFFLAAPGLRAAEIDVDGVRDKLEPLLSTHCYDCHDDVTEKGELNLLDLDFSPSNHANFEQWQRVFERVENGEMPPKKKERPEETLKASFLTSLESPLLAIDEADKAEKGRVRVRRLTRTEYENTLHDLLGIDSPLVNRLPEEIATDHFETVASGQQFSHFNLERFLEVADHALDEAFLRAVKEPKPFVRDLPAPKLGRDGPRGGNYRGPETRGKESLHWPMRLQYYGRMPATSVPESGWYRITLKNVRSINSKNDGVVWGTLRSGACSSNEPILYPIGLVEATTDKRDISYEAWIREGHMLELKPNDGTLKVAPSGATGGNVGYKGRDLVKQGYQGIGLTGITIERIYPNATRYGLRTRVLGGLSKEERAAIFSNDPEAMKPPLKKTMLDFASRAFRRPVTEEEIAPYIDLAFSEFDKERPVHVLKIAYRAMLCSPRFLSFVEKPGRLDDHALAARMSYMLWSTMPDDELRALADKGTLLADAKVRHAQVNRMLEDPKAERFIESFTDQWLNLKEIDFTVPDRRFKTYDPVVRESILEETRAFVRECIVKNKSVTNLVQSDFAMLNERLKRFYGLKNVNVEVGEGLQRVALKEDRVLRGGLVTQGSILKVTADGSVTSPIIRGVWVAERIIGMEIPPPPPGVAAVEPDIRGAVSIRDQLDKHRNDESCAGCHQNIDPAGFALEAFDPVGLLRTKYGSKKTSAVVDPSGVTPDGVEFADIKEWKQIYLDRPTQLARGFARQLLTYATGASTSFSDRADLEKIVTSASKNDYGMKSIVHAVIASDAFRYK